MYLTFVMKKRSRRQRRGLSSGTPSKEKKRIPRFYYGIVERMADYFLDGHAKTNHLWSLHNRPLWVACELFIASQLIWLNRMVQGQRRVVHLCRDVVCND